MSLQKKKIGAILTSNANNLGNNLLAGVNLKDLVISLICLSMSLQMAHCLRKIFI